MADRTKTLATVSEDSRVRQLALEQMNDALKAEFEDIAEETQKQAQGNVMFYHKLGERTKKIHADTQKYGEGAVEKLSAALTIDKGLVYKAMSFAEMLDRAELKALMERRTTGGNYITWSHFAQLVHVVGKDEVAKLVEEVFEKDLSVRDLRDLLRQRIYSGKATGRVIAPRTVMGGLSQLLTMSTKLSQKFTNEFDESVFGPLDEIEGDQVTEEMLKRVTESERTLAALAEQTADKAKEMTALHTRLAKAAADAAKRKEKEEAAAAKAKEKEEAAAAREKEAKEKEKAKAKAKEPAKPAPKGGRKPEQPTRRRERRPIEA